MVLWEILFCILPFAPLLLILCQFALHLLLQYGTLSSQEYTAKGINPKIIEESWKKPKIPIQCHALDSLLNIVMRSLRPALLKTTTSSFRKSSSVRSALLSLHDHNIRNAAICSSVISCNSCISSSGNFNIFPTFTQSLPTFLETCNSLESPMGPIEKWRIKFTN